MPVFLHEKFDDDFHYELHYELWVHEPFGSSFLLCLVAEDGEVIEKFILAARYGRLLTVLEGAANREAEAEEWRGYISAENVCELYAALSNGDTTLQVQSVRALVFELRKLARLNFANVDAGAGSAPPLIETRDRVGYRLPRSFLKKFFR